MRGTQSSVVPGHLERRLIMGVFSLLSGSSYVCIQGKYSTYDRTWASQLELNWAGAGSRGRGWGFFLDRVRVRVRVIGLSEHNITGSHGGSVRSTDTWSLPRPARIKNPGDNRRERCLVLMPPGRSSSAHSRQQYCCAPTGHRTAASA